ncbi:MAG TPA: iron chelate uptake ABC transporter family permease subunit, partial [Gammaproteobacteria bacterium]|nr:iron chelate uptake ABC transporter family permease subunit [Gammaproteobacteria bacterium]
MTDGMRTAAKPATRPIRPALTPGRACLLLGLATAALAWASLPDMPLQRALAALTTAPPGDAAMALLHFSWWPRLCVALLCGGGLSLAGVLMQQVLRNPLAAPTTLGVATGANLALALASLYMPALLSGSRVGVALAGGGIAMGLVFLLSWRHALAPVVVVLAGLVVNLYFSALDTVLLLFHPESLASVLIWQAGS